MQSLGFLKHLKTEEGRQEAYILDMICDRYNKSPSEMLCGNTVSLNRAYAIDWAVFVAANVIHTRKLKEAEKNAKSDK